MKEFWNETLTQASWEALQRLSQKYDFILIGGWAAFLWTGKHKSKDIDIIAGFKTLQKFKQDFPVVKNDRLKRYEARLEETDVDIYVPFYSDLTLPLDEVETTRIQGIKTISAEELLVLKQGAEIDRRGSVKGKKDAIDIVTLLLYADIDLKKYKNLLRKHELNYEKELEKVVKSFDVDKLKFLRLNLKEFRDWQKKFLAQLRKA